MKLFDFSGTQFAQPASQPASLIDSSRRSLRRSMAGLAACFAAALIAACGGGSSAPGLQISASVVANTTSPITGQEVRLSPSLALAGTVPAGATVTQVRWDFGDGSPVVSLSNAASLSVAQFKSYATAGSYIVTLGATASTGESGSVTRTISVQSFALTGVLANSGTTANIGNYTRLGADGQPLAIQTATWANTGNNTDGTRWECIKDNQSGLIWEVKSKNDPSSLRHFTATFTWYDTNPATNGGAVGTESGGAVPGICPGLPDPTKCNTLAYTNAVKTLPAGQALCGFRDWRMPSDKELTSIILPGPTAPIIRATDFPDIPLGNSYTEYFWSATPIGTSSAFATRFSTSSSGPVSREAGLSVRLVRSGR
jgi:Protein of unknown function (DUF1566)/PKD domain